MLGRVFVDDAAVLDMQRHAFSSTQLDVSRSAGRRLREIAYGLCVCIREIEKKREKERKRER